LNGFNLADSVEGSTLIQLNINMTERLEPSANATCRLSDPTRDAAHPTVVAGEQRDDAIGFAQLLSPQHDCFVTVKGHSSLSPAIGLQG
jgi:hypothetical protein